MSEIISQVPWDKLVDWVRDYSEDRHYKGKATVVQLRDGTRIEGAFRGYSRDKRTLMVASDLETKGVPVAEVILG